MGTKTFVIENISKMFQNNGHENQLHLMLEKKFLKQTFTKHYVE